MSNTSRIAKNTLLLYFRQILIMLVSLYTVRIVLSVLGAEDYGIYNVTAGVVTMFGFLSGAMATASQRYFAFDLGKKDYEHLRTTFSVTFQIYVLLAVIIVILAESVGLWFVTHKLVIPDERLTAAIWIYQAAVVSFLLTLITTPYMASIIAHENMNIYAYVSIVEAVLKLGIVFLLQVLDTDKLILYGLLLAAVALIKTTIYWMYCKKHYQECKFQYVREKGLFRELVSYSGWNLFGSSISIAKNHLVNISINMFCGSIVNASRAIAIEICNAANSFVLNFSTALNPNIIKLYAQQEQNVYREYTFRCIRYVFLLFLFISSPIIAELPDILRLWLNTSTEYVTIFSRLALVDALVCSIFYPLGSAVQATGKIKMYQIKVGTFLFFNFPISYILLQHGYSPIWTFYIAIILSVISLILRLIITRKIIGFKLLDSYVVKNFLKMMVCAALLCMIYLGIKKCLDIHFIWFLLLEYSVGATVILLFGIEKKEILVLYQYIKRKIHGKHSNAHI